MRLTGAPLGRHLKRVNFSSNAFLTSPKPENYSAAGVRRLGISLAQRACESLFTK